MGKDETMQERYKRFLERCVQQGVAYLDANPDKEKAFDEWYRRIDLTSLDLSSGLYCIIGQTLGDYSRLIDVDDFKVWRVQRLTRWAQEHGFLVRDHKRRTHRRRNGQWEYDADLAYRDEAYDYLTELWSREVGDRQLARALSDSLTGPSDGLLDAG